MNPQDSQSELETIVADIIADARSIDVGFAADEPNKYKAALNEGVKTIEAYVTTRVKEAEELLRAEVNFYKDRCKMERNKYDILAKSTQEKVKEAERLARIDELKKYLEHYGDDYDRYADARIIELKALTTTTNGKET